MRFTLDIVLNLGYVEIFVIDDLNDLEVSATVATEETEEDELLRVIASDGVLHELLEDLANEYL